MATFLAQNQFNSAHVPEADDAAASSSPLPPDAAAALSMASSAGAMETEAADVVRTAAASDIEHINEIFFYARKLIADGRRFVLDEAAFMAAIDEDPLFLRSAV